MPTTQLSSARHEAATILEHKCKWQCGGEDLGTSAKAFILYLVSHNGQAKIQETLNTLRNMKTVLTLKSAH
jgi:hypothetical protein